MLIDVVCEAGGGLDEGKTPISEEYLIRPTPNVLILWGIEEWNAIFIICNGTSRDEI